MAATRTTAPEHFASIGGSHTLAKAMHPNTAANFGLVSTFRHFNSSLKGIILLFEGCTKPVSADFHRTQPPDLMYRTAQSNKSKPFNGLSGTTLYRKVQV